MPSNRERERERAARVETFDVCTLMVVYGMCSFKLDRKWVFTLKWNCWLLYGRTHFHRSLPKSHIMRKSSMVGRFVFSTARRRKMQPHAHDNEDEEEQDISNVSNIYAFMMQATRYFSSCTSFFSFSLCTHTIFFIFSLKCNLPTASIWKYKQLYSIEMSAYKTKTATTTTTPNSNSYSSSSSSSIC